MQTQISTMCLKTVSSTIPKIKRNTNGLKERETVLGELTKLVLYHGKSCAQKTQLQTQQLCFLSY